MSETGRRVLTAVGLVPAVAVTILVLPSIAFQVALVAMVAGGAWEWSRLARLAPALAYAAGAAGTLAIVLASGFEALRGVVWLGAAWWLVATVAVVRVREPGPVPAPVAGMLAGWLVLVPAGAAIAMVHSRPGGPALVMTLFAVVWAADTGAWMAGRRFGRRRLAPRVSPGKTWEGVAGGMTAAMAAGAAGAWWMGLALAEVLPAAALAAVASVVGDLYASLAKRRAGVKDSGRILPGHGGVLDRIDGLAAAAPLYAVAMVRQAG